MTQNPLQKLNVNSPCKKNNQGSLKPPCAVAPRYAINRQPFLST